MTRRVVVLLLLVVACESDEAKLERLQSAAAYAHLGVVQAREHPEWPADSLLARERRKLLADRALRTFLDGR